MRGNYGAKIIKCILLLTSLIFTGCAKNGTDAYENNIENEVSENSSLDSWMGSYKYMESYSGEDTPFMFMSYEISIYKEEGNYYAEISIDGQTTMAHARARVYGSENWISMVFEDYYPDHLVGGFLNHGNSVLISLQKEEEEILTYWGEITPMLHENEPSGKCYFEKTFFDSIKSREKIYQEFIEGSRKAGTVSIHDLVIATDEPGRHYYSQYALFDSTGDGLPELHVKTARDYIIYTCKDNEMVLWTSLDPATVLFDDGTFMTENTSHAGYKTYNYFALDSQANEISKMLFMETESGYFEVNNMQVTNEQWKAYMEPYLGKNSESIHWIGIFEETN